MQIGTFTSTNSIDSTKQTDIYATSDILKKDAQIVQKSIAELNSEKTSTDKELLSTLSPAYTVDVSSDGYLKYQTSIGQSTTILDNCAINESTSTDSANSLPTQTDKSSSFILKHSNVLYGNWSSEQSRKGLMQDIGADIKNALHLNVSKGLGSAVGESVLDFKKLANSLNAYLEVYGNNTGFFDDIMDGLNEIDNGTNNPLLMQVRSMVETVQSGKFIDTDADFELAVAGAANDAYSLLELGTQSKFSDDSLATLNAKMSTSAKVQKTLDDSILSQTADLMQKLLGTDVNSPTETTTAKDETPNRINESLKEGLRSLDDEDLAEQTPTTTPSQNSNLRSLGFDWNEVFQKIADKWDLYHFASHGLNITIAE